MVRNKPKHRGKGFIWMLWLAITLSFFVAAAYLILGALGYRINLKTFNIVQLGIITLETQPEEVSITLDSTVYTKKTPFTVGRVYPGVHDIKVEKNGYNQWIRTIYLESGRVYSQKNIVLFLADKILLPVSDSDKDQFSNFRESEALFFNGGEIYYQRDGQPVFATRLNGEIKSVAWYTDKKHIAYQLGKQIRVSELDGQSDQLIAELNLDDRADITFQDSGKILLVRQKDSYYKLKII